MRTFIIRDRKLLIEMFNLCIRSKIRYCCVVWPAIKQAEIDKIGENSETLNRQNWGNGTYGLPWKVERTWTMWLRKKMRKMHNNIYMAAVRED